MNYSVVIPALNEERCIGTCIQSASTTACDTEVIVADGGSTDATARIARDAGARVVSSFRGRGRQCNTGAAAATGEVLLFLHADTQLPPDWQAVLDRAFARPQVCIGTFRLHFEPATPLLNFYSTFTRFDSLFTRFGDQCIVVRRSLFEALGRFPEWPLFEDVHFLRLARRRTRIYSFPAAVTTSARRFLRHGPVRQQFHNTLLILRYLCGTPAHVLAHSYDRQTPVASTPSTTLHDV